MRGIEVPEVAREYLSALDQDTAESDDVIDEKSEVRE
jgi:hypothetical protein